MICTLRLGMIDLPYFSRMIPGKPSGRFISDYLGIIDEHDSFDCSVDRFYFIALLHCLVSSKLFRNDVVERFPSAIDEFFTKLHSDYSASAVLNFFCFVLSKIARFFNYLLHCLSPLLYCLSTLHYHYTQMCIIGQGKSLSLVKIIDTGQVAEKLV